jgi:hypothetical protein
VDWPKHEGRTPHPIGQRRAVELNALPSVNLGLPIKRKVIGVFGDQDLRYGALSRQSALNQPRRRGRLHNHVLATAAAIFGPANDEHPELRRHDVETFARVLADPMQRLAATRTSAVFDVDQHLDAWQMSRKRSAIDATLGASACPLSLIGYLALGLLTRRSLLDLFEPEQHLIFGKRLSAPAKTMTLQFLDDLTQAFGLQPLGNQHRFQRAGIVGKRIRQIGHGGIRSCATPRRERFQPADSPCRSHPGCIGAGISRAA